MLRIVSTAIRGLVARANDANIAPCLVPKQFSATQFIQERFFGGFSSTINTLNVLGNIKQKKIIGQTDINTIVPLPLTPMVTPVRTAIKFSRNKGKRKTVKAVIKRFYRLHWGIWIRTIAGRHNKVMAKSRKQRRRYKTHVFCNATQSTLLDKMVTHYWKRPTYYVDDPYNPYHKREEFPYTRRTPQSY